MVSLFRSVCYHLLTLPLSNRNALRTAREEWDKDFGWNRIVTKPMWQNVSVEDLVYAERIHFKPVESGLGVWYRSRYLGEPIIEAALKGHSEIVELVLDQGAKILNITLAVAARWDSSSTSFSPPKILQFSACRPYKPKSVEILIKIRD